MTKKKDNATFDSGKTFDGGTTFDDGEAMETGNFDLSRWWLNLDGD